MVTDLTRLSDGTYGRELGRVSPEGNIYGTTRWVRDVLRNFWWNGARWLEIGEDIGQSNSVQLLPTDPQDPDTVWRCLDRIEDGKYIWKYFFWDAESQSWQPILWYWTVDSVQELPNNPWFRGQAHEVKEPDVQAMWDGYTWRRIRISSLEDDIGIVSTLETYGGTLQGLSPEVELIYISPVELTLKPINSDFEYVTVNSIVIDSSKRTSVYSFSPVLDWWDETESFSMSLLQHSTNENSEEYWVYLANKDSCFNLSTYDFRGRLFCSKTTPNNNRLGKFGSDAYNAVLIGRCQTAVPDDPSDRVEFLYELDVSLVSRAADLKETFREFSDFDLVYVDENTLRLDRIYGTMGQIFIAGSLYYLGESIDLTNSDVRIIVDGNGLLEFDDSEIATDTIYYVYIASNSDIFNDNEINPATSMPWHPEDDGAGNGVDGPYYAAKDLRLKLFLSTKTPEEGRLAETWRGFWARHIGQVRSDAIGKFIYSSNISSIRQATLNPSYFDGLAEARIVPVDNTEFILSKKSGSSGIIMVGGSGVETYDELDESVHRVRITDLVFDFDPDDINFPIEPIGVASDYKQTQIYLYMANAKTTWGDRANKTFFSVSPPVQGYLSTQYPGNNARWIATIAVDSQGGFSGDYVKDALQPIYARIDDSVASPTLTWSSLLISSQITHLTQKLDFILGELQRSITPNYVLEFYDSNTLFIKNLIPTKNIGFFFPNDNMTSIEKRGRYFTLVGVTEGIYYIYLRDNGTIYSSKTQWDLEISKNRFLGNSSFLLGIVAINNANKVTGPWSVVSAVNQPTIVSSEPIPISNSSTTTLSMPYLLNDKGMTTYGSITGSLYIRVNRLHWVDTTLAINDPGSWVWRDYGDSYNTPYDLGLMGEQRFGLDNSLKVTATLTKPNTISNLSVTPNWSEVLIVNVDTKNRMTRDVSIYEKIYERLTVSSTSTAKLTLTRTEHI